MPWASIEARISSPIGPSSTWRMWAIERNTNGIEMAIVSGTMLFSGAALMRIMSRPPIFSCSMVSRSAPSVPAGKTLTPSLSFDCSFSALPMWRTASTVG